MLKTYRLTDDRKNVDPTAVYGKDAVKEWLRAALSTTRGEQPYLPDKYGIDMMKILHGDDPIYYLVQSIEDTVSLRNDVWLTEEPVCWQGGIGGRDLYASIKCATAYGNFDLKVKTTADGD